MYSAFNVVCFGLDHRLVQTVGTDSVSAEQADMKSVSTQYITERIIETFILNEKSKKKNPALFSFLSQSFIERKIRFFHNVSRNPETQPGLPGWGSRQLMALTLNSNRQVINTNMHPNWLLFILSLT